MKAKLSFVSLLFFAILTECTLFSFAQLPLLRRNIAPFPLKILADGSKQAQKNGVEVAHLVGSQAAKISISTEGISAEGKDTKGGHWAIKFNDQHIGLGYYLYSGDIDRNGLNDIVLITYTGANGFLPYAILSIVTFDRQGRPNLWQDGQDVLVEDSGIAQIVDLDSDSKAELITTHYDYDGGDKWDGYYVVNIYQLVNARWHKLKTYKRWSLPLYSAYSPKSGPGDWLIPLPEKLPSNRKPFAAELDTSIPVASGILTQIRKGQDNLIFSLRSSSKQNLMSVRQKHDIGRGGDKCYSQNYVLTIDSKNERKISVASFSEMLSLAQSIRSNSASLYGTCADGKLSARYIWITK